MADKFLHVTAIRPPLVTEIRANEQIPTSVLPATALGTAVVRVVDIDDVHRRRRLVIFVV